MQVQTLSLYGISEYSSCAAIMIRHFHNHYIVTIILHCSKINLPDMTLHICHTFTPMLAQPESGPIDPIVVFDQGIN